MINVSPRFEKAIGSVFESKSSSKEMFKVLIESIQSNAYAFATCSSSPDEVKMPSM